MTTGACIFAFNNEKTDYVRLAAWNGRNIRRHLDLPVAVITDDVGSYAAEFDQVIVVERPRDAGIRNINLEGRVLWHNTNRMNAYELSPWDRTLLLDADYVVASQSLLTIIHSDLDLAAHRKAYDITSRNDFAALNSFGAFAMPMWWATVIFFTRSKSAEIIFDCMRMVRDNWGHYRDLYGNRQALYRNDHALSIALTIESGHTLATTDIPWNLATVMPDCEIRALDTDAYRIGYTDTEGRPKWIFARGQDLHVMAKTQLENLIAHQS